MGAPSRAAGAERAEPPPAEPAPSDSPHGLVALATIAALGLVSFGGLRATCFRGYDEWLIVWMVSRGIVSFPHANRPLGAIWHLPAWWVAPDRLWGFALVHGFWLTAVGGLTFLIVRRLLARPKDLAFVAGALAVAWMPSETGRTTPVQMIQYSGCAAGVLLATWLLIEAWCRRSRLLLPCAIAVAAVTVLSLEASLAVLATAPFLLLAMASRFELRRWLLWTSLWLAALGALAARVLLPLLTGRSALSYQLEVLGATRSPRGVIRQVLVQLGLHLRPILATPWREILAPAVPVAILVFVLGFVLVLRVSRPRAPAAPPSLGAVALAGAAGITHAVLAYLPFVLPRATRDALRTEFLAAPGIAVFLAAGLVLLTSWLGPRARRLAVVLAGAWIVGVGTGRTLALAAECRAGDAYRNQSRTLRELTTLAPRVQPHTLMVLLQAGQHWTSEFAFLKAVEYLYEGQARGSVPGAAPLLYETRFSGEGVASRPAPAIAAAWGDRTELYRYDELVVFDEDQTGMLRILDTWPADLDPLPPGASYAPRRRLRDGAPSGRVALLKARY